MTESIHGHQVMEMMLENDGLYTEASLTAAIAEKFGSDARFHTCSAQDMNIAELITFLRGKGKFIDESEGFNTRADKICDH